MMHNKIILSLSIALLSACATTAGQEPGGVLVMAHGGDDAWNTNVREAVAPLAAKWPVEIAYGMATSSTLEDAVSKLESRGVKKIAVVRMFVSGDSWIEETEYIFGLRPALDEAKVAALTAAHQAAAHHAPPAGGAAHGHGHKMEAPRPIAVHSEVVVSKDGLGESPLIDAILVDRVRALSSDPANETVLVLAHGPGDDEENTRWMEHMDRRLDPVRALGAFRKVEAQTLREDWPAKRKEAEQKIRTIVEEGGKNGGRVIIVPFRVSGFGPYKKVLEGLSYVADERGFLPHANVTQWIDETATRLFSELDAQAAR